ncbi:MAG: tetratricopeptide repeat protein [Gammaproteobacteria bacterium]|nr:tetratricopeptide repeat protein [Gammaproteobacteria bacterium]
MQPLAVWRQGQYAKAEPPLQRSLAIREQTLGPEHGRPDPYPGWLATWQSPDPPLFGCTNKVGSLQPWPLFFGPFSLRPGVPRQAPGQGLGWSTPKPPSAVLSRSSPYLGRYTHRIAITNMNRHASPLRRPRPTPPQVPSRPRLPLTRPRFRTILSDEPNSGIDMGKPSHDRRHEPTGTASHPQPAPYNPQAHSLRSSGSVQQIYALCCKHGG